MSDDVFDAVDRLAELATAAGLELHELAHAWVLSRSEITSMIVGPRTVGHVEAALAAAGVGLSQDLLDAVDRVVPPGRATLPQYGHDGLAWTTWGPHRYAWR